MYPYQHYHMAKKIKQYRKGLSHFVASEKGQRFFNFAYSIGAAIVIWGALFKILHLPGGNTLLSVGMGTEVMMFLLTAFDRPPKEYNWEDVFPALRKDGETEGVTVAPDVVRMPVSTSHAAVAQQAAAAGSSGSQVSVTPAVQSSPAFGQYASASPELADEMAHLLETTREINKVHDTLLESYKAITDSAGNISGNSHGYVEQMQALNHNIAALNTIYEIQLKSVSGQLDSIDRVNKGIGEIRDMFEKSARQSARYCEEAEKMARNMQQINQVYERMITAMTINMYPGMAMAQAAAQSAPKPSSETTDSGNL